MKNLLRIPLVFALVWMVSRTAIYLLPGDPAEFLYHDALVKIELKDLRSRMDLDRGITERIFTFPKNQSLVMKESASQLILRATGNTILLSLVAILIAIPSTFGLLYLRFRGGLASRITEISTQFAAAIPILVLGPILLRALPLGNPGLPALTLALSLSAFWYRALSKKLEASLPSSSVLGARALGFSEFKVFYRSLLTPALGSFLAYFGTQLGILMNGSVLVEALFHWNGLGSLMTTAVLSRDYPVIELGLMAAALLTLISQQAGYGLQKQLEPKLQ